MATLTDNIFKNNIDNFMTSGSLFNDLSDHLPIFVIDFDDTWFEDHSNQFVVYRDGNPSNMTKLNDQLGSVDWFVLESINDPRVAYTTFHTKFTEIYNSCFPIKKRKIKRGGIHKPWLYKGLLKSIKGTNVLYRRYVSNPTHNRECFYKNYRNRLNHSLRLA